MDELFQQRSEEPGLKRRGRATGGGTPKRRKRRPKEVTPERSTAQFWTMGDNHDSVYYALPSDEEARREVAECLHWSRDEIMAVEEAEALRQAVVFLGKHLMWGHVHKDGTAIQKADGTALMAGCRRRNGPDIVPPEIPGFHFKYDEEYERPFIPLGWNSNAPADNAFNADRIRADKEDLLRHALLQRPDVLAAINLNADPNPDHQLIDTAYIGVVLARYNHFRGRLARAIGTVARHQAYIACILERVGAILPAGMRRDWRYYSKDRKTPKVRKYVLQGQRLYQEWMNEIARTNRRHVPEGALVKIGKRRETAAGNVETTPGTILDYWTKP